MVHWRELMAHKRKYSREYVMTISIAAMCTDGAVFPLVCSRIRTPQVHSADN